MRRFRFHEEHVSDGTILAISDDAVCLSIQIDPSGDRMTVVTWFEEVEIDDQDGRELKRGHET